MIPVFGREGQGYCTARKMLFNLAIFRTQHTKLYHEVYQSSSHVLMSSVSPEVQFNKFQFFSHAATLL